MISIIEKKAYIPHVVKQDSEDTISRYWGKPSLPPSIEWPVDMKDEYLDDDILEQYPGYFHCQFLVDDLPQEVKNLLPETAGMILFFIRGYNIKTIVVDKSQLSLCRAVECPESYEKYLKYLYDGDYASSHVLKNFEILKEYKLSLTDEEVEEMDDDDFKAMKKELKEKYGITNWELGSRLSYRDDINKLPKSSYDNTYAEDKFLGNDFFENNGEEEIPEENYTKLFQLTVSGPLGYNEKKSDNPYYGTGNVFILESDDFFAFGSCD